MIRRYPPSQGAYEPQRPWVFRGGWTVLLLAAICLLAACSDADSLGGEPLTEVQVGSPPRWDNGIGELMRLKCGVCHQVPPGPLTPAGTPQSFDLNFHILSPNGVPGAQDGLVLTAINGGILRGPFMGSRQMPLVYATPLAGQEINALEAWSLAGGP